MSRIIQGDVRERLRDIPDESVHCVVTSPPYWALRDYGVEGQIGLEETPEAYVENMVAVFREVRRVLRRDGTCWLNLGDSYAASFGTGGTSSFQPSGPMFEYSRKAPPGLKPKDLCMIPARVALALQADGWWLRSEIIWSKPNPMPESVTDRPTKSHEYLFLLTKNATYFYDAEAIRESQTGNAHSRGKGSSPKNALSDFQNARSNTSFHAATNDLVVPGGRNRRTVWEIATEAYPDAHFATFPTELVKPCILAGTSEWGCCSLCGAPWVRQVERGALIKSNSARINEWDIGKTVDKSGVSRAANLQRDGVKPNHAYETHTTGWAPTCKHEAPRIPCIVLDPFLGSGTTALVAKTAGRDYIGIELNPAYVEMAEKRIKVEQERFAL